MNRKFRGMMLAAVLAGLTMSFCIPAVAASNSMVLKISHQFPAHTDFRDQLARKFAAQVTKRTNGALKFQIYPGASLFKAKQQFTAMQTGALDMSVYPLAYAGGKYPATNITLMPALITSYTQAYNWENAPIGKWLDKYLSDHGVVLITWIWQAGGVVSHNKPILVPDDVKGLKVRGAGKMIDLMLQAAGAGITALPSNQAYEAMKSGLLNALWTSSASLLSFRLDEVGKYVTTAQDHTFWYMFEPLLMSKITYDKLTPKQQKIVKEVGRSLSKFALQACKKDDNKVAKVYAAAGDKVLTMNAKQFALWKAVADKSAYKAFAKRAKNGAKLIHMAEAVPTN